jgi:acyl-coenzyme A thioesterase PaaI-like protein
MQEETMTAAVKPLETVEPAFGLEAAARLLSEALSPWVQDLGLVIEKVEGNRPAGASGDWQPGALVRLPYARTNCAGDGTVCSQALLALADTTMMFACAAAWDGYRPMTPIDQTMHFLRPASFDVVADARVLRISRTTTFGRVTLLGAADRRPLGTVLTAYALQ